MKLLNKIKRAFDQLLNIHTISKYLYQTIIVTCNTEMKI